MTRHFPLIDHMPTWRRARLNQGSIVLFLAVIGLPGLGCDSTSFMPARPAELTGAGPLSSSNSSPAGASPARSSTTRARQIELIVGPREADEAEAIKTSTRAQAGLDKIRIQVTVMNVGEPASEQVRLVRDAIGRDPAALVVEPVAPADPELADSLNDARKRGVQVVMVGRPLTDSKVAPGGASGSPSASSRGRSEGGSAETRPLVVVVPESFGTSAQLLAMDLIRNAKNGGINPASGVALVIDNFSDPMVEDRVRALREAFHAAGIDAVKEVRYERRSDLAKKKLAEFFKSNTKVAMFVGVDFQSLGVVYDSSDDLGKDRSFVIAGYSSTENSRNLCQAGEFAAVAVYSSDRLLRKAVHTAAEAVQGANQKDLVELQIPIHESPPSSSFPRMKGMMRRKDQARDE